MFNVRIHTQTRIYSALSESAVAWWLVRWTFTLTCELLWKPQEVLGGWGRGIINLRRTSITSNWDSCNENSRRCFASVRWPIWVPHFLRTGTHLPFTHSNNHQSYMCSMKNLFISLAWCPVGYRQLFARSAKDLIQLAIKQYTDLFTRKQKVKKA